MDDRRLYHITPDYTILELNGSPRAPPPVDDTSGPRRPRGRHVGAAHGSHGSSAGEAEAGAPEAVGLAACAGSRSATVSVMMTPSSEWHNSLMKKI